MRQDGIVQKQNELLKLQLSAGSYPQTPSSNFKSPTNQTSARASSNAETIRFLERELSGDEVF
jgi:hypothetical protein